MKFLIRNPLSVLFTVLLLSACGGGGGGGLASVQTLGATTVSYGRTMTVNVSGSGLTSSDVQMIVEGPCGPVTKVSGGTDLFQSYSCLVTGVGPLYPRIRTAEGVELASMSLTVPLPQVTITVSQTVGQATRAGNFIVELDPVAAPVTASNFVAYVNEGYYKSTLFHRVIQGFVAQGGGFTLGSLGPVAKQATHAAIKLESNNGLTSLRGTIAMARTTEPNSATTQFYINLADNLSLDYQSADQPGYAVFGKVVSGMDVVDEIGKVPTATTLGAPDVPVSAVTITAAAQTK